MGIVTQTLPAALVHEPLPLIVSDLRDSPSVFPFFVGFPTFQTVHLTSLLPSGPSLCRNSRIKSSQRKLTGNLTQFVPMGREVYFPLYPARKVWVQLPNWRTGMIQKNLELQPPVLLFNVVRNYSATLPEELRKKLGQALLCCVREEDFNGFCCTPRYLPSVIARFIDVELGYWFAEMSEAFRQEPEYASGWDYPHATIVFRRMLLLVDEELYRNFHCCFGSTSAEELEKHDRKQLKCLIVPSEEEFA